MKLNAEQLGKLNSAMDTLSVNQEPAREDMSTIAAMSEVLNTSILEFQQLSVNHLVVHPEGTTLACELELLLLIASGLIRGMRFQLVAQHVTGISS